MTERELEERCRKWASDNGLRMYIGVYGEWVFKDQFGTRWMTVISDEVSDLHELTPEEILDHRLSRIETSGTMESRRRGPPMEA